MTREQQSPKFKALIIVGVAVLLLLLEFGFCLYGLHVADNYEAAKVMVPNKSLDEHTTASIGGS